MKKNRRKTLTKLRSALQKQFGGGALHIKTSRVKSSNIHSFGYDSATKRLTVKFKKGREYQYRGVPKSVVKAFRGAGSHGKFFHKNIRDRYPYRRLG